MTEDAAAFNFLSKPHVWLSHCGGSLLAEMVLREPGETVGLVHTILRHLRSRRAMTVDAPDALAPLERFPLDKGHAYPACRK